MKNISRHQGVLRMIQREPNSYFGNPRFSCFIDETGKGHGFSFVTGVDSMHGYEIQNYFDKEVIVTIGSHYGRATLNSIERALP